MKVNKGPLIGLLCFVAFIFTFVIAAWLQPDDPKPIRVGYTIADKMEDYVQHKYNVDPTYNLLLVSDYDKVRSVKQVSLLTYHDAEVGGRIYFMESGGPSVFPWPMGLLLFYGCLVILLFIFGLIYEMLFGD